MHKPISRYLAFLLLFTLSLHACQKAPEPGPEPEPREGAWTKVHYRAAVSGSAETKATLDAIDRHYLFERDDLLYVVDSETGGDKLYGFLFLISGAEATEAVFEGDLMYFVETAPGSGTYEPERPSNNLAVSATLVSQTQREAGVYTIETNNDGKIASGPDFGNHYAATFKDAVRKYSTFTAEAKYGDPSFHLVQGTAFLIFSLAFEDSVSGELALSVTNNDGADNLFSRSFTPDPSTHDASFVAAFPGGTITLHKARMRVTDGGSFNKEKALAAATLQGNRYYNVTKTFLNLDYFTIQAREAATTISFPAKYQDAAYGLQYSSDGSNWTNVSETSSFELAAGNSVMVRGKGSKYQNSDGTAPLFTSSAPCYIYGDIMSLFCTVDGDVYTKKTVFGGSNNNALEGTFKNMTNLDIHPARPLLLSATTLANYCYQQMFAGSSITRAPEFNNETGAFATDIPTQACDRMFQGCTSLSAAPELPANGTIASKGYYGMFDGCTAMATPPSRLAVTPSGGTAHFQIMFQNCTSLLYASEMTTDVILQDGCRAMFNGCTALTEAPAHLATTISGTYAYAYMFQNCSSLTQGPSALPATNMQNYCYAGMFKNCTLLEEAPRVDAVTLATRCFFEMFSGCSKLRTAQDAFAFSGGVPEYACYQMFLNCIALTGAPDMPSVGGTIENYGCKEMYKGCIELRTAPSSLKAVTVNKQGYYQMFYNCDRLTNAPSIEATNIGEQGCMQMFYDCLRLATPPASLLATDLAKSAYKQMFYNCDALTSIPDFYDPDHPSVEYHLANGTTAEKNKEDGLCFQMFYGCDGLERLDDKQLFNSSTPLGAYCFQDMFSTCKKLSDVPSGFLPATTLAESCYRGMFQQTAITSAPDLLAPTLVKDCYRFMFNACKSLSYIKCYTTTNVTSDAYTQNWLQNAKTTGDFHYRDGVTWTENNTWGIPSGWTRHAE